ncbi:hypothetical protein [Hahella ganghwensis]|uniref:hypothetical protein n=1 Tax=Hahella ganghwensis TaxID=286420 RepID=UPI000365249C|nr:hypothetical protein [Hahella ganghwensis]
MSERKPSTKRAERGYYERNRKGKPRLTGYYLNEDEAELIKALEGYYSNLKEGIFIAIAEHLDNLKKNKK